MNNIKEIEFEIRRKIEPMIINTVLKNNKDGILHISTLDLQKNLGLINENFYTIVNNQEPIDNIANNVDCNAKAMENYLYEIYDDNKSLIYDVLSHLEDECYISYADAYKINLLDGCTKYVNTEHSLKLLHDRNTLSYQVYKKLFYELSYDEKKEIIKKVNLKYCIQSHQSAFILCSDVDTLKEIMREKYNKFNYNVYKKRINELNQERINFYNACNQ